ncbi:MAG: hypothetical protein HZB29_02080 [Nitrospinae bacterium]|nr:hypothetical protein [Nitrospinota bacterium]
MNHIRNAKNIISLVGVILVLGLHLLISSAVSYNFASDGVPWINTFNSYFGGASAEAPYFLPPVAPVLHGIPLMLGGAWLAQAFLMTLAITGALFVKYIAESWGELASLLSVVGYALIVPFHFLFHVFNSDSIFAWSILLFLAAIKWATTYDHAGHALSALLWFIAGTAAGIAILSRPTGFILIPLACAPLFLPHPPLRRIMNMALFLAGLLSLTGAWVARNIYMYNYPGIASAYDGPGFASKLGLVQRHAVENRSLLHYSPDETVMYHPENGENSRLLFSLVRKDLSDPANSFILRAMRQIENGRLNKLLDAHAGDTAFIERLAFAQPFNEVWLNRFVTAKLGVDQTVLKNASNEAILRHPGPYLTMAWHDMKSLVKMRSDLDDLLKRSRGSTAITGLSHAANSAPVRVDESAVSILNGLNVFGFAPIYMIWSLSFIGLFYGSREQRTMAAIISVIPLAGIFLSAATAFPDYRYRVVYEPEMLMGGIIGTVAGVSMLMNVLRRRSRPLPP